MLVEWMNETPVVSGLLESTSWLKGREILSPKVAVSSWTGCVFCSCRKAWFMSCLCEWHSQQPHREDPSAPPPPLNNPSLRTGTPAYLFQFCIQHLCSTPSSFHWPFQEWMYMSTRIFHKAMGAKRWPLHMLRIFSSLEPWWIVQNNVLSSRPSFTEQNLLQYLPRASHRQ